MNLEILKNNPVYNSLKSMPNEIYLVGGAVRDAIMGKISHDLDIIVTDCPAKEFAAKFAQDNDTATMITLDEVNNIYRVVMSDKINYVDITNPVNNSLEEDIKRRDITINAIALNIKTNELLDLTGGVNDLENCLIRAISEENMVDDPLRMIRVFRFGSTLGFGIDKETEDIIKKHTGLILMPAVERRNCEILKLFGGKHAHEIIKKMDKIGLIDILFPIMLDVKKVPPNTHHHLDLFNHSIETVKQIQEIYESSNAEVKEHLESCDFGGDTRLAHLKLAGFLHDIGKFSTWTIEDNGRHRFIKHDEIGEELAKGILKKQKFSKKQIDYIGMMIRHHIYPSAVISSPVINDKIYMRYIRKTGDNAIDLITLAKADRLSARGPMITDKMIKENIDGLNRLQEFYLKIKPTLKPIPILLNGNEIMELLNIKPSKKLGEILNNLHEAQMDEQILTKEDAINYVKSLILQ